MTYPKNPDSIVTKLFYPSGLTEKKIWEYYQENKNNIIEQNKNRNVMIFILLDDGSLVVRKRWKEVPIKLTPSNYDEILSGRSISVNSLMRPIESIAIVDVDSSNFEHNKEATKTVFRALSQKSSFIEECSIRYTGKTGFHIFCQLNKKMNINVIKIILKKLLINNNEVISKYTVQSKRGSTKPNIDLTSNRVGGGFITLGSLSIFGLRCMEVNPNNIMSFKQLDAKIK